MTDLATAPVSYSPYDYDVHEDPFPTYARLRAEAPLYRNEDLDFWALSRYADVHDAFAELFVELLHIFDETSELIVERSTLPRNLFRIFTQLLLAPDMVHELQCGKQCRRRE